MLELIDILQSKGTIKFRQDFLDEIGYPKQSFRNVKLGIQSFRIEHIKKACEAYNVNANWIFGIEKQIFRPQTKSQTIFKTSSK